jgi:nicotinate-nucleotide--dimethylbenzimidazole phosphoribosyltransferase
MPASGLPFDDIRALVASMPAGNEAAAGEAQARDSVLVKPPGALGRLEDIAFWLARWQGKAKPQITKPTIAIFGSDHGVTKQGVSPYPSSVTRQMLDTFAAGGAAINQICLANNLALKVFDLGIGSPSGDITIEPAMDEREAAGTIAFGMEAIADGADIIGLGEMGIGNTTIAAAIYAALFGGDPTAWVGRGTGADDAMVKAKADAIARALDTHAGHLKDPLEVLRRLGGREIAAMVGAIVAARHQKIPVVLDGFVTTAAAAIVQAMNPRGLDHCIAGHFSAEQAHHKVLERLRLTPLLSLGMRLGEGTGAALAMGIIKAAAAMHNDMATFTSAGVDNRD